VSACSRHPSRRVDAIMAQGEDVLILFFMMRLRHARKSALHGAAGANRRPKPRAPASPPCDFCGNGFRHVEVTDLMAFAAGYLQMYRVVCPGDISQDHNVVKFQLAPS
jgi:hypothetical protein